MNQRSRARPIDPDALTGSPSLRPFAYLRPVTLEQTIVALSDPAATTCLLAGGTDLIVRLRRASFVRQSSSIRNASGSAQRNTSDRRRIAVWRPRHDDVIIQDAVYASTSRRWSKRRRCGLRADSQPRHARRQHLQRIACRGHRAAAARIRSHRQRRRPSRIARSPTIGFFHRSGSHGADPR